MEYKTLTIQDIINWCQENKQVAWLKAIAKKTIIDEEGNERKITFFEIKKAFAEKFMPEILPVAKKEKKPTMYDLIASL